MEMTDVEKERDRLALSVETLKLSVQTTKADIEKLQQENMMLRKNIQCDEEEADTVNKLKQQLSTLKDQHDDQLWQQLHPMRKLRPH